jgi:calcineurin-like phosphoesterase family protein
MKKFNFQKEDDLQEAILEIIASYKAIMAEDVWFELGECERLWNAVTHLEVNKVLSQLEGKKLICKGKDERWRLALKKEKISSSRNLKEDRNGRKKQFSLSEVR